MKQLLSLLMTVLFASAAYCQAYYDALEKQEMATADTMKFHYPFKLQNIDLCHISKNVLYTRCYYWLNTIVTSGPNVKSHFQIQDKTGGKLMLVKIGYGDNIYFSVTIDVKEGKYRCTLDDVERLRKVKDGYGWEKVGPYQQEDRLEMYRITKYADGLFANLHDYVRKDNNNF
jgi:hypothetical protein